MPWPFSSASAPDADLARLVEALTHVLERWARDEPANRTRIDRITRRIQRTPIPEALLKEVEAVEPAEAELLSAEPARPPGLPPELAARAAKALVDAMGRTALVRDDIGALVEQLSGQIPSKLGAADARSLLRRAEAVSRDAKPLRRDAIAAQEEMRRLIQDLTRELAVADALGGEVDGSVRALTGALDAVTDADQLRTLRSELLGRVRLLSDHTTELRSQLSEVSTRAQSLEEVVARQAARIVDLRAAANLDPLTGVANRRAFERWLEATVPHCQRTGTDLALVLFDVDHFKQVNDRFGHPRGDEVLRQLAERLAQGVRADDEVARVGGEEFAVILRNAPESLAEEVAERLRQRASFSIDTAHGPWPIRISGGVASLVAGDTPKGLYARADKALYDAKHSGRDTLKRAA